jgi:uncharacterized protein YlxW (UPF0749 family)
MRRQSSRVAITVVLFVLGFLVVAQLRAQTSDPGLASLSVAELTELVANVTTRNNQLRREVDALERQRESLASAVERGDTSAGQIRADLNRILAWSGALGVRGEGVTVTVNGAIPGDAVELLLNELRNAGAEAISIGAIRIVPGVVVTGPEGSKVVNGIPLSDPIEIHAIGQPQTLAGSLSRAGGPIARLAARFPDVLVTVTAEDLLVVPPTDRNLGPVLGRPRL